MNKSLPYILGAIVAIAAFFLIVTGGGKQEKKLDERISLRVRDKIPYGAHVAYEALKYLFPHSSVCINKDEPGYWDSLSNYGSGQALIIVSPTFYADDFEMKKIIRFVENGNDVFISAAITSDDVRSLLNCGVSYVDMYEFYSKVLSGRDTLQVSLVNPPFERNARYSYPGKRFDSHFFQMDTSLATALGNDQEGIPNFIHLKAGLGHLYFHLAPMAFTNYFLLREKNMQYYQDLLSVISPDAHVVVWDEYYLNKRLMRSPSRQGDSGYSWITPLLNNRGLKWGILTSILILLVYILLEMRRKQRLIPVMTKPRNDSLDFVKTIGRLYFDKGDHKNLCRKMAAYFLEHVRNRYKLATSVLDDEFVKNLQFKTGVNEGEINRIVSFIHQMDNAAVISDRQLIYFHKQLESFYSKT